MNGIYSQIKTCPMAPHTEKASMSQPTDGCLLTKAIASASSPRSQNDELSTNGDATLVGSIPRDSASAVCARYGERSKYTTVSAVHMIFWAHIICGPEKGRKRAKM